MSHLNFGIFSPIFGLKVTCLVHCFQKLAKLTIFGIFHELLSTQNVNVARIARNLE